MARQLPDLNELQENFIADNDQLLVRDTSAKEDKRFFFSSLKSALGLAAMLLKPSAEGRYFVERDSEGVVSYRKYVDTGWRDFSWTNSTYIGTSQSSYNRNQWRIKDDVLYVICGAGATATINTSTETEIARIPVKNTGFAETSADRVWVGAVGGSGAYNGFILAPMANYISVHIKPHTTANGQTSSWFSSYFSVPLSDDWEEVI